MSLTNALQQRREALENREDREAGFTLIELLVVVIIIGILAAIAIPIYLNVQNGAKDSAAKSDLTNAKTAEIAYYTANNSYVTDTTQLGSYGFTASGSTPTVTVSGATFCASVASASGTTWKITQNTSPVTGTC